MSGSDPTRVACPQCGCKIEITLVDDDDDDFDRDELGIDPETDQEG